MRIVQTFLIALLLLQFYGAAQEDNPGSQPQNLLNILVAGGGAYLKFEDFAYPKTSGAVIVPVTEQAIVIEGVSKIGLIFGLRFNFAWLNAYSIDVLDGTRILYTNKNPERKRISKGIYLGFDFDRIRGKVGLMSYDTGFFNNEIFPLELILHLRFGKEEGLFVSLGANGSGLSQTAGGLLELGAGYGFGNPFDGKLWIGAAADNYTKSIPLVRCSVNVFKASELMFACGFGKEKLISALSLTFKYTIVL